jgi:hypothetical protein
MMTITPDASAHHFGRRAIVYRHHFHHRIAPVYRVPSYHYHCYPRTRVYYGVPRVQYYHPPIHGGFFYSSPGVSIGIGF